LEQIAAGIAHNRLAFVATLSGRVLATGCFSSRCSDRQVLHLARLDLQIVLNTVQLLLIGHFCVQEVLEKFF
jgi:hypothetical protein